MKNLQISTPLRLRTTEFPYFMEQTVDIYDVPEKLEPSVHEKVAALQEKVTLITPLLQVVTKHELTPQLQELETRRYNALLSLKLNLESAVYSENPEVKKNGTILFDSFNLKLGKFNKLSRPQKTAHILNLTREWASDEKLIQPIVKLNLDEKLKALEEANKLYYKSSMSRLLTKRKLAQTKKYMAETYEIYESLITDTQAFARVGANKSLYQLILENMNNLNQEYIRIMNNRKADKAEAPPVADDQVVVDTF